MFTLSKVRMDDRLQKNSLLEINSFSIVVAKYLYKPWLKTTNIVGRGLTVFA